MIAEFKEFISKGNVVDMAVGVIIGSAFTAIVNSLVADIFTPIIGIIIGGIDFASLSFKIPDTEIDGKVITQGAELTYGNFIQSIITFLLTAVCVFIFVKVINAIRNNALLKKKEEEKAAPEPEPEPPKPSNEELLLTEIRDLLKSQYGDGKSAEKKK
ncbi:MAG: large-conductance mechanosensitive channel protein MscL [Oscillospiraceae bacterium]|nr:large-conductance mechanosensitive channel protein MscL [Oscillospiraceae bacterium]